MLVRAEGGPLEVFPLRNVAADPAEGSRVHRDRGAETMFVPDPKDLYRVNMLEYDRGAKIVGVFHSHPDHDAYFSATDREWSVPEGVESYPGAEYLVVSIRNGKAVDAAAFRYDPASREFVRRSIQLENP
jgi:[CysO sulfur-carrier protein]-S-L-cysteine hydrolase